MVNSKLRPFRAFNVALKFMTLRLNSKVTQNIQSEGYRRFYHATEP